MLTNHNLVCSNVGPWKLLTNPTILCLQLKNLMVVGVDSYHDSAMKGRSVGAFVASMNSKLTRYYSRCVFQHTMQELMDGLKVCMQGE